MVNYDKHEIRNQLTIDNIYQLLEEWGGEPTYESWGLLSSTICHNQPGEGSRKLYYYSNTGLFQCWTGCGSFDIFQLLIKIARIQWGREYDLNDAVRYIAVKFGLAGNIEDDIGKETLDDWRFFNTYDCIQELEVKDFHVELKEYNDSILSKFLYNVKILPWLRDGISQEIMQESKIGFYPGGGQITIPHYNVDGKFIGLRGRALAADDVALYGKYRPIYVNRQLYNHPLGMNLYNLNNSKNNISIIKKAIIFESEKSTLQYRTMFGDESDITVACCGSNISAYQIQLLLDVGAKEIVLALDRQFQAINDDEFKHLTSNLTKINNKYKNYVDISIIFDKNMITPYKASPTDCGKDIFMKLWRERIKL